MRKSLKGWLVGTRDLIITTLIGSSGTTNYVFLFYQKENGSVMKWTTNSFPPLTPSDVTPDPIAQSHMARDLPLRDDCSYPHPFSPLNFPRVMLQISTYYYPSLSPTDLS
jgi:hypothetical protein